MKTLIITICGIACTAFALAQEPASSAPAAEAQKECTDKKCDAETKVKDMKAKEEKIKERRAKIAERRAMSPRVNRQMPTMIVINEKTTPEQIEAYKKQVAQKIDEAVEKYKNQKVEEGKEKSPVRVMLNVIDRPMIIPQRLPRVKRQLNKVNPAPASESAQSAAAAVPEQTTPAK